MIRHDDETEEIEWVSFLHSIEHFDGLSCIDWILEQRPSVLQIGCNEQRFIVLDWSTFDYHSRTLYMDTQHARRQVCLR